MTSVPGDRRVVMGCRQCQYRITVSTTRGSGWVCDSNQMWNNTDLPLAYLITFRCYESWLHGDERGSVDRFHNQYKSPYLSGNEEWHQHNARKLKCEPVVLDAVKRKVG
jgi:hypothetical protein